MSWPTRFTYVPKSREALERLHIATDRPRLTRKWLPAFEDYRWVCAGRGPISDLGATPGRAYSAWYNRNYPTRLAIYMP